MVPKIANLLYYIMHSSFAFMAFYYTLKYIIAKYDKISTGPVIR